MGTLVVAVLPMVVTSCASTNPSTDALAGKSGAEALQLVLRNATAKGMMSYDITLKASATQQTAVGDAGPKSGDVVVTDPGEVLRIVVTGGVGYIQSNAAGLQGALGVSSAAATASANRWISVTPADSHYDQLVAATSFSSILAQFTPGGGRLRLTETTVAGHRVGLIDGTGKTPDGKSYDVQLVVTTRAPVLPVGGAVNVQVNGKPATQVALFSRWGRHIRVTPPVSAIPLSAVTKG